MKQSRPGALKVLVRPSESENQKNRKTRLNKMRSLTTKLISQMILITCENVSHVFCTNWPSTVTIISWFGWFFRHFSINNHPIGQKMGTIICESVSTNTPWTIRTHCYDLVRTRVTRARFGARLISLFDTEIERYRAESTKTESLLRTWEIQAEIGTHVIAHPDWVKLRVLSLCLLTNSNSKEEKWLVY